MCIRDRDTEWGVIYARGGPDAFELPPYRLAIDEFLRFRATPLLLTPATEAHYHVCLLYTSRRLHRC